MTSCGRFGQRRASTGRLVPARWGRRDDGEHDPGGSGGAAGAGQLGSSIGAALLGAIAATATAGYVASHPGSTTLTATDHGYAIAMAWGVGILLVTAVPVVFLVNARGALSPRRPG
jgi:hypothetical protein